MTVRTHAHSHTHKHPRTHARTNHANQCQSARAVRQDEEWCGKGLGRDARARASFAHGRVFLEMVLLAQRAERVRVPRGAIFAGHAPTHTSIEPSSHRVFALAKTVDAVAY